MLYKPSFGKFKDNCVIWHEGRFSLFAMFHKGDGEYRNVWMAESEDGVHWKDVGPVIEDAPFFIWAMGIHAVEGKFILNHGSFGAGGAQNVLKFWESTDLRQWRYRGERFDVQPDPARTAPHSRLDCMSVIRSESCYYGYATGPQGFLRSADGLHWEFCDTRLIFGETPPPPTPAEEGVFEVGGCSMVAGSCFYLGGWFNYCGRTGYGVYTLVSNGPQGPFRPDVAAYRLCGNSGRWVSLWARFCPTDGETLINGYMQEGYSYENGETWLPPLKKAVVDEFGHLRLGYWKGNDSLRGQPVETGTADWRVLHSCAAGTRIEDAALTRSAAGEVVLRAKEHPSLQHVPEEAVIALLDRRLECGRGIVVEGEIEAACVDSRLVSPSAGILLEEDEGEGTAIWLDGFGRTRIGAMAWRQGLSFHCEDVIDAGCAAPAGIAPNKWHGFRLLVRRCMFELYIDGFHVQTFNTTHGPDREGRIPRRIGFLAANGQCRVRNLGVRGMAL